MSIYTALARYIAQRRSMRDAMRIADLPLGVQKDIGWPDAHVDPDFSRSGQPRHRNAAMMQ